MTRKKSHKRFRQKKNNNASGKIDKLPLIPNSPDNEKQNFLFHSAGKTPIKTPNFFFDSTVENRLNQQTPDDLFHTPLKISDLDNLFSPRFFAPRIPKLKLDFDTPENDSDHEDFGIDSSTKVRITERLSEKFESKNTNEWKISSIVENGANVQINKVSKVDSTIKISESESGYDSNSPTNKQSSTSFVKEKDDNSSIKTEAGDTNENQISIKSPIEFSNVPETIITLPQKKYYNNTLTLKSHCILFRQSMFILKNLKLPFPKVTAVFSWISSKIGDFIKQIFTQVPKILVPRLVSQPNLAPVGKKDFNQILSAIRCENEKTLTVLSLQVTNFSQELNEIRTTSEISIKSLTREVTSLREANEKLVQNSCNLVEELKSLHETLKKIQSTPKKSLPVPLEPLIQNVPTMIPPPPPLPLPSIPFIPPPPPLPPSPFPRQNPKTPTTPKSSSRKCKRKTPAKKSSSTSQNRPSITVEDLLKVTLKKAPNSSKENLRRNSFPVQKGPAISLDMLRSVKLRSSRSKPSDLTTKSPRNRSAILNNRSNSSPNMSPASSRSENPLDRILMQVDLNKPRRRKSTTPHETDLKTTRNLLKFKSLVTERET